MSRPASCPWFAVTACCLLPAGCWSSAPPKPAPPAAPATSDAEPASPAPANFEKLDDPHLPNAWRLHPRVISGGLPDGEAGFAALAALGVKTVISVDGAKPDLEAARKHGLRYVHLPHGYDGVPAPRGDELAVALRTLEGPIYVHCHHGKHRSPAAAGVACVRAGLLNSADAERVLAVAGTSPHYIGLFASVRGARPAAAGELEKLTVEFVEISPIPPMAEAMVEIEHLADELEKFVKGAGVANLPQKSPAHAALLLREQYRELARSTADDPEQAALHTAFESAEQHVADFETSLRDLPEGDVPAVPEPAATAWTAVRQECTRCHKQHRDVPHAALDKTRARAMRRMTPAETSSAPAVEGVGRVVR